ncbi:MAG: hypothetical protein C4341_09975 [Armatimonadota bacterium]
MQSTLTNVAYASLARSFIECPTNRLPNQHGVRRQIGEFRFERIEPGIGAWGFGMRHQWCSNPNISREFVLEKTKKLRAAVFRIVDRATRAMNED